jgi:hypothetical protein
MIWDAVKAGVDVEQVTAGAIAKDGCGGGSHGGKTGSSGTPGREPPGTQGCVHSQTDHGDANDDAFLFLTDNLDKIEDYSVVYSHYRPPLGFCRISIKNRNLKTPI